MSRVGYNWHYDPAGPGCFLWGAPLALVKLVGFFRGGNQLLWRVLLMAFKTYKTQQRFGAVLVLVGNLVIFYHPKPIAGVMMIPLLLVGGYHSWAGYKRYKRERSK